MLIDGWCPGTVAVTPGATHVENAIFTKIIKIHVLERTVLYLAVSQRRGGGEEEVREAHEDCLEHVSAYPTIPSMSHKRAGPSLGKSKFFDFEILAVRFRQCLPFLAPSSVLSPLLGGTSRFLQNLTKMFGF